MCKLNISKEKNIAKSTILMILCSIVVAVFSFQRVDASFQNLLIGDQLPQLQGKDVISLEKISTDKFIQDEKIILICFWAEWSGRSIEELQFLQDLSDDLQDSTVQYLSIYTGRLNSFNLNTYLKSNNISIPVLRDERNKIADAFGLIAVPSTIITDKIVVIRFLFSSFSLTAQDHLIDSLDSLLGRSSEIVIVSDDRYKPVKKALRFYNAAFKLFGQRSYEQALDNLKQAQVNDSLYLQPYLLESVIRYELAQYEKAVELTYIVSDIDSTLLFPQLLISRNLIRKKEYNEAAELLNKVIKRDSTNLETRFLLVDCYLDMHQSENAQIHLDYILLHYSNHPKALFQQALLYTLVGNKKSAVQTFMTSGDIIFP